MDKLITRTFDTGGHRFTHPRDEIFGYSLKFLEKL
jgi:hypothetical protein